MVVLLHVSAFSKHWEASRQEHGGCPGFSVIFTHCLPASHAANDGELTLHSQVGGVVVILQVSALARHVKESKQEHGGCPGCSVMFKHTWGCAHASNVGPLKLHSQPGGFIVVLQVSAFPRHCDASRHEQAGCSGCSVIFKHFLPAPQVANDGALKLHSQVGGTVVLLQVSAFSKHVAESRHEHPGCPGSSVTFIHN